MIQITDKSACCGCSACVQICPKHCISFKVDDQGFGYPVVDEKHCVDCHLCERVCPCLNQNEQKTPLKAYAAINSDIKIRKESSSGGIFTMIAESVLAEGGVVFGARFNEKWEVIHDYIETVDEIKLFRGSKYVQSYIGDTFKEVNAFLKMGRKVLFSGTPCQIAGLKKYLLKDYENLITVDIVCHGVPSPKIWHDYQKSLKLSNIKEIIHKSKESGWYSYSLVIKDNNGNPQLIEKASKNAYLQGFKRNYILRPSCFSCPAKAGKSESDITLGDFWGIENYKTFIEVTDGVSYVGINTMKGSALFDSLPVIKEEMDFNIFKMQNPCIIKSTLEPKGRDKFWDDYFKYGIMALNNIHSYYKIPLWERVIRKLKSI